ncbi:MAG: hypothetical protein AABX07_02360 [Nanoarchaeota archaeon]
MKLRAADGTKNFFMLKILSAGESINPNWKILFSLVHHNVLLCNVYVSHKSFHNLIKCSILAFGLGLVWF